MSNPMRLVVGCDLEEFKEYYKRNGYGGEQGTGELGETEYKIAGEDQSHLIVWREDGEIIGHAIWHETSIEEHIRGDARDKEDRRLLENLLRGKKRLVELHEGWLMKEYRGKGYGKEFSAFFEELIRNKGYDGVIYYADHPAAIAVYRQCGYEKNAGQRKIGMSSAFHLKRISKVILSRTRFGISH